MVKMANFGIYFTTVNEKVKKKIPLLNVNISRETALA